MLCFQVLINGTVVSNAGVDPEGVMTAIVSWVTASARMERSEELTVSLGGLRNGNDITWLNQNLRVGDEVTIRIIERDVVDGPSSP